MALGDAKASQTLLEEVEAQGFRAYMVPEICGLNRDCRNFICVPSERPLTDRLLVQSTAKVIPAEKWTGQHPAVLTCCSLRNQPPDQSRGC